MDIRINDDFATGALVDTGSNYATVIDQDVATKLRLPFVEKKERKLGSFSADAGEVRSPGVVVFTLKASGHDERIYAYVAPGLGEDLILGLPWMEKNSVVFDAANQRIYHRVADLEIRLWGQEEPPAVRALRASRLVTGATFAAMARRRQRKRGDSAEYSIMAISLADVEKALRGKEPVDPGKFVPAEILKLFPKLFSPDESMKLPSRRPGFDVEVNILRDADGKELPLPWGPLYAMSKEELLVLRKTLTSLLEKGFIRASSSPAAAPVLFAKKPGGGLRFCCDYRALNAISKKDRYPLPLITETLRSLSEAKWFTKLDVVAAFHKLRMAQGHEEKTAFRTRFGSFEWTVCPFGLSGAPAAFQRYVNSVLREYLGDFVTAFVDDVLIYTGGSRGDHMEKVKRVLRALAGAGLHLDPTKSAFATQEVKYLGFIVRAGEGIACDPEKQRVIREWEAPTTVKGVQSFLRFANYYRIFIPNFSLVARPLTELTKKGRTFVWGDNAEAAFQELKSRFCEAPILRDWNPARRTFLEADCSRWALGGVLSQEDEKGRCCAVAFHSQKLLPAECNYPIHDKELLGIIRCLEAWRSELRSYEFFTIVTDHKNLQYFITKRQLNERQVRWANLLSEFHFDVLYRPGSAGVAPDALSRREQDMPKGPGDDRETGRYFQLLPARNLRPIGKVAAISPPRARVFTEDQGLQDLWDKTVPQDPVYLHAFEAVEKGERRFPAELGL